MAGRVIQIAPAVAWPDAISAQIAWIHHSIGRGNAAIYVEQSLPGQRLPFRLQPLRSYRPRQDDLVLIHYGTRLRALRELLALPLTRILFYHNITPPRFFAPYEPRQALELQRGREEILSLAPLFDAIFCDSNYSLRDFDGLPIRRATALPGLFPSLLEHRYQPNRPPQAVVEQPLEILHVGRIVPNKNYQDLLKIFSLMHRRRPELRLRLVGSFPQGLDSYRREIESLIESLRLRESVIGPELLSDSERDQAYRRASLYMTMSLHEGFCVPLLEACREELPVIAFAEESSAIEETLDQAGVLCRAIDHAAIAELALALLEGGRAHRLLRRAAFERWQRYQPQQLEQRLRSELIESQLDR